MTCWLRRSFGGLVVPLGVFLSFLPSFLSWSWTLLMRVSIPKDKLQDTEAGRDGLKPTAGFNVIGIMLHSYHWKHASWCGFVKSCKVVKVLFPPLIAILSKGTPELERFAILNSHSHQGGGKWGVGGGESSVSSYTWFNWPSTLSDWWGWH